MSKKEITRLGILKILNESPRPIGAARIRASLLSTGLDVQTRTIRLHLLTLDREGFTTQISRRTGRIISDRGRKELAHSNIVEKVGVVASRVDNLAYRMTLNPALRTGSVVLNVSLIQPEHLSRSLNEMKLVFRHHLAVCPQIMIAQPGEIISGMMVPDNHIAIGTVCSVTLSGALIHQSIPVKSRFSGLLEVRERLPIRFVDLIDYAGSTLDPLEIFIQANMTRVRDVILTGNGILCAAFREIPTAALGDAMDLEKKLRSIGIGGIIRFGQPNQPLLGVPVSEGHAGLVVYGGLNPIAALRECGLPVVIKSMAGLEPYSSLKMIEDYQRKQR
jgi:HTH-type transcriptional regulator, global nitrogen regulator NrpRI